MGRTGAPATLWVVSCSHHSVDTKQPVQLPGELHHELWTSVGDDAMWESMQFPMLCRNSLAAPSAVIVVLVGIKCALFPTESTTFMTASCP